MDVFESDLELEHVAFVHRHGARSPIFSNQEFPSVPKWNFCKYLPSFYAAFHNIQPGNHALDINFEGNAQSQLLKQLDKVTMEECYQGQLTDQGKIDMRKIGEELRSVYIDRLGLLSKEWKTTSNELYLRSTNYLRTIESLQHLLHGLYPKQTTQGSPKVYVMDSETENMYPHDSCSSMVVDTFKLREKFAITHHERMLSVLNPLSFWHEMHERSPANQTYRLYDMLSCMIGNNVELPKSISEDAHGKLEGLTVDIWARLYEQDEHFTKRAIGRFIPSFIDQFKRSLNGDKNIPKLAIFSGHDSTIIPLLIAFKVYNGEYPRFGANVVSINKVAVEQFKDKHSKRKYVRMLYNGKPMTIPACREKDAHYKDFEQLCTLEAFLKQADKMSLTEEQYQKDCFTTEKVQRDWD